MVILLILSNQLEHIFYNIGLDGLDFWMFGIVFISIIYSKIFKIGIYLHHKIAIGFISIFYGPLMFFYNFLLIDREETTILYIKYKWIIPIGIIIYLLIIFLYSYSFCKLKLFLDLNLFLL